MNQQNYPRDYNLRSRGGPEDTLWEPSTGPAPIAIQTELKSRIQGRSGRIAPRWIHDLVHNSLSECAIFEKIADEYKARTGNPEPHVHKLLCIRSQSSQEEAGPHHLISFFCSECSYHFVLEIDDNGGLGDGGAATPCGADVRDNPLHHFVWAGGEPEVALAAESTQYSPVVARERFACSAPRCTTHMTLSVSRPRVPWRLGRLLQDEDRIKERIRVAQAENPERFSAPNELWISTAPTTLRAYLRDILEGPPPQGQPRKKIATRNKRFYVQFGPECDELFNLLEFEPKDIDGDQFWLLPVVENDASGITTIGSRRAFFEDAENEINTLVLATHPDEARPLSVLQRLEKDLRVWNFAKSKVDLNMYSPTDFAMLGASTNFSGDLLMYAYKQQVATNPREAQNIFGALKRVAQGRGDYQLELFVAQEESLYEANARINVGSGSGLLGDHEMVLQAYNFFRLQYDCNETDDFIINTYKVQVDASPKQKDTARDCLAIIAKHRKSDKIAAVAQGPMDLQEAATFLEVDLAWPAENIAELAMVQVNQNSKAKKRVAEAMRVIGEHLDDMRLKRQAAELASEAGGFVIDKGFEDMTGLWGSANNEAENTPVDLALPVGLENIGNTCYLNSLLQYLFTVKAVRDVVVNFDDYKMDPTEENIQNRRIGGYRFAIDEGEALVAQEFVKELQTLFGKLETAATRSVRPTQRLANAALLSTSQLMEGNAKPQTAEAGKASLNKELPPPPPLPARPSPAPPGVAGSGDVEMTEEPLPERAETASIVSSQTLVNVAEVESDQSYVRVDRPATATAKDAPMAGSDRSSGQMSSVAEITKDDIADLMYLNNTKDGDDDVAMMDVSEAAGDGHKVAAETKISNALDHSVRQGTEQQDVEEVMGNIIQRLHSAIRPTYEDAENNLQMDKITETFYCTMVNYTKKTEGGFNKEVVHERWLTAFPETERIDLYAALDRSFDMHYVEGTRLPRYTSIRDLPPILHVCIQRSVENGQKNGNPVTLPEILYLDRYMDAERDSQLMELRKQSWTLKGRLHQLRRHEAERAAKDKPQQGFVYDVVYNKYLPSPSFSSASAGMTSDPGATSSSTSSFPPPPTTPLLTTADDEPTVLDMLKEHVLLEAGVNPKRPLSTSGSPPAVPLRKRKTAADRSRPAVDLAGGFDNPNADEQQAVAAQLDSLFAGMTKEAYRLHAVICHQGQAARSGHYWVYIYDFARRRWRKYNDSRITDVDGDLDLKGEEYYVAYVRDDVTTHVVDIPERNVSQEDIDAAAAAAEAARAARAKKTGAHTADDDVAAAAAKTISAMGGVAAVADEAGGGGASISPEDAAQRSRRHRTPSPQGPAIEMQDLESGTAAAHAARAGGAAGFRDGAAMAGISYPESV